MHYGHNSIENRENLTIFLYICILFMCGHVVSAYCIVDKGKFFLCEVSMLYCTDCVGELID